MISRRSVLRGLLAAPIVVRPGLLMPGKPFPHLYGDGIHDDREALQAWFQDRPLVDLGGFTHGNILLGGEYYVADGLTLQDGWDKAIIGAYFVSNEESAAGLHIW